ncbi:phosphatase PAP2 family protein [Dictyobacter kobayashii]|uniref:Phosphatidic acid phosphatase type 2/haloperoxidase domain-containing protein n=1 Tax=Dictyobacter kobayashii TaxID=2014872 RepID=A0A402AD76_9CHLR|nr:phosphatase PAP2 family protein [Dictyobacter kobayashii]GCE17057.1 hypothetical protein KDK_08570 [Dictyobacter kobayashii]
MQTHIPSQKYTSALPWFIAAVILGIVFLIYTAANASGILNQSTLEIERSLLWRPITRVDCSFLEWRNLGEVPATAVVLLILGGLCILAGHKKRILAFFLLLLCICVGFELGGKMVFAQQMPPSLRSGMTVLTCPQMEGQPVSVQLSAALGLLGQVPDPPRKQVSWARDVAQMPIDPRMGDSENGYPGGHAARWCLAGLIMAWMSARYLRPRFLGRFLAVLISIGSLVGGFMQFYIGVHFITDTIAGYLLGIALGCCGIGFMLLTEKERAPKIATDTQGYYPGGDATIGLPRKEQSFSKPLR